MIKDVTMYKAIITVVLRPMILDPQGKTIEHSLHQLGYTNVSRVKTGKHIELVVSEDSYEKAQATVEQVCSKLLANTVMEDYSYELVELKGEKANAR